MRIRRRARFRRSAGSPARSCCTAVGARTRSAGTTPPTGARRLPPTAQIYTLVPAEPDAATAHGHQLSRDTTSVRWRTQHDRIRSASTPGWTTPGIRGRHPDQPALQGWPGRVRPDRQLRASARQTKYSEAELNVMSTPVQGPLGDDAHLSVDGRSERLLHRVRGPPDVIRPGWNKNGCDGDFNDFVFYVTGLDCEGGGEDCRHGMHGICAGGTTQCSNGGMTITCQPNIQTSDRDLQPSRRRLRRHHRQSGRARPLSDRAGLQPGDVCVFPCSNTEFPCGPPTVCDTTDGLCKDPSVHERQLRFRSDLRSRRLRRRL